MASSSDPRQPRSPGSPRPSSLLDLERRARERMEPTAWDYYAGGADDEVALAESRLAWQRVRLHYRVLAGVGTRSTAARVLGHDLALPVLVAPMAFQGLAHPEAELATARAAAAAGSLMILSTLSNERVEDVVATSGEAPVWFQLYIYRDRAVTRALVERAEAAGCRALVLTVDAPIIGRRERDARNRFHLPAHLSAKNLLPEGHQAIEACEEGSGLAAYIAALIEPGISWEDLEWLRGVTRLPLLVKGIVRADDAARAVEAGAAGVIVSNHGGRQLDAAPPTAEVLPRVAEAVAGRAALLVDGGVRRGTDVVRALSLGADAVLLGRPILWGLAADGERGVRAVLELLRAELDLALALCGCRTPADVDRGLTQP